MVTNLPSKPCHAAFEIIVIQVLTPRILSLLKPRVPQPPKLTDTAILACIHACTSRFVVTSSVSSQSQTFVILHTDLTTQLEKGLSRIELYANGFESLKSQLLDAWCHISRLEVSHLPSPTCKCRITQWVLDWESQSIWFSLSGYTLVSHVKLVSLTWPSPPLWIYKFKVCSRSFRLFFYTTPLKSLSHHTSQIYHNLTGKWTCNGTMLIFIFMFEGFSL